jgi:hypothetical protein
LPKSTLLSNQSQDDYIKDSKMGERIEEQSTRGFDQITTSKQTAGRPTLNGRVTLKLISRNGVDWIYVDKYGLVSGSIRH